MRMLRTGYHRDRRTAVKSSPSYPSVLKRTEKLNSNARHYAPLLIIVRVTAYQEAMGAFHGGLEILTPSSQLDGSAVLSLSTSRLLGVR